MALPTLYSAHAAAFASFSTYTGFCVSVEKSKELYPSGIFGVDDSTLVFFIFTAPAVEIAKTKDITVTAVFELATYLKEKEGVKTKSVGLGSWINYSWGRAVFVPAFHSSSLPDGTYGGVAAGIILDIDGVRIYHAGDTCLTGEMKTIKELYAPQVAFLPIGGNYTMDVEHAAMATRWLGVRTVIPMHYGSFPEIEADLQRFAQLIAIGNTTCQIVDPMSIDEKNKKAKK